MSSRQESEAQMYVLHSPQLSFIQKERAQKNPPQGSCPQVDTRDSPTPTPRSSPPISRCTSSCGPVRTPAPRLRRCPGPSTIRRRPSGRMENFPSNKPFVSVLKRKSVWWGAIWVCHMTQAQSHVHPLWLCAFGGSLFFGLVKRNTKQTHPPFSVGPNPNLSSYTQLKKTPMDPD